MECRRCRCPQRPDSPWHVTVDWKAAFLKWQCERTMHEAWTARVVEWYQAPRQSPRHACSIQFRFPAKRALNRRVWMQQCANRTGSLDWAIPECSFHQSSALPSCHLSALLLEHSINAFCPRDVLTIASIRDHRTTHNFCLLRNPILPHERRNRNV